MNIIERVVEKNIVIYGTGINAERLISVLLSHNANIVGIMDKDIWSGNIESIPIISWDDIVNMDVDVMIIAAADRNIPAIYQRIKYRCERLGIQIFSNKGINLSEKCRYNHNLIAKREYYSKCFNQLCLEIDTHDVISFDIFDTLLMRKVWEPTDIFDLVDMKIREQQIVIPDFKKKRHMAELDTHCAKLDIIYKHLADSEGLDKTVYETIMNIEIEIERKYLCSRLSMIQAFEYAVRKGKEVYLISDMYIPMQTMENLLEEYGINGYKNLYISCEYDLFKAGGLYDLVRKENNITGSWLHIGDDEFIDGESAIKSGIDTYIIKSARDMLRISSLEKLMLYTLNKKDRYLLGSIVAELFADPFALHESCGLVKISRLKELTKLYYISMSCAYMERLIKKMSEKLYDKVLFLARDGYMFKSIYEQCNWIEHKVKSIYLYASRRLNLLATTYNEDDINRIGKHYGFETNSEDFWKEITDGLSDYSKILDYCEDTRTGYQKYLYDCGISRDEDYLICDLLSSGTIHKSLNTLLDKVNKGFYLHKTDDIYDKGLDVDSVFDDMVGESVKRYIYILENVFTTYEPSVKGCVDGKIEFLDDRRSDKQISVLKDIQEQIISETVEYLSTWKDDETQISADFLNSIIGVCQECEYVDDAYEWLYHRITDDLVSKEKDII